MSSFCRPWLHYVPLSTHANEEELMGLLHFLQENQDISRWTSRQKCLMIWIFGNLHIFRSIAEAGADFITSHLRLEDISCYWSSLLHSYTALLDYTVVKDPTLVKVKPRVPWFSAKLFSVILKRTHWRPQLLLSFKLQVTNQQKVFQSQE